MALFKDREEAGLLLAKKLLPYQQQAAILYAIPRGGVVIADPIATLLSIPLSLIITRKVGHPNQPEYAIAAVAEDGHLLTSDKIDLCNIDAVWFKQAINEQRQEAQRRRKLYLQGQNIMVATNKIAILVDDGIATGLTLHLAITELRHQQPKKIIVAVPVAPQSVVASLQHVVDEVVAHAIPQDNDYLGAVGAYYQNFPPVIDKTVITIMHNHLHPPLENSRE